MPDSDQDIQDFTEDFLASCVRSIAEHGWMVQGVFPTEQSVDKKSWCYTIGLTLRGLPEILVVNLPVMIGTAICNDTARKMIADGEPELRTSVSGYSSVDMTFLEVAMVSNGEWFNVAHALYGDWNFRVLQAIFPDKEGHFPWHDKYSLDPDLQPLLGVLP